MKIFTKYIIVVSILTLGAITQINAQQGIGTPTPTNALHINATDPLRLEGLQPGAGGETKLVVDANGVVKTETVLGVAAKLVTLQATSVQVFSEATFNNILSYQQVNFIAGDIKANTLGVTMAGPNVVLTDPGFYEVSGSIHFRAEFGYVLPAGAIGINIRVSVAGTPVAGTRTTITNTSGIAASYATVIALQPTIIEVTVAGSGIGLFISRGTGDTVAGGFLGADPELIKVPDGMQHSKILTIKKL